MRCDPPCPACPHTPGPNTPGPHTVAHAPLREILGLLDDAGLRAHDSFAVARLLLTQPDSRVLIVSPSGDRVFSFVSEAERVALRVEPYIPPVRVHPPLVVVDKLMVLDERGSFNRPDLRVLEPSRLVRELVALAPPAPESYVAPPPFPKSRRSFKRNARKSKRSRR